MTKTNVRLLFALALGGGLGALTFAIEILTDPSSNSVIASGQATLFYLLLPGMFGSMAAGGNVHAFHLWIAAVVNAIFYFVLGWISWGTIALVLRRRASRNSRPR